MPGFTTEGVDHVGVAVSDIERSEHWYRDVLGLERVDGWGDYPVILVGRASGVALFRAADGDGIDIPPIRILHIAFRVSQANLDVAKADLTDRGIEFDVEDQHGIAQSVYLADPDGHRIELIAYHG